MVRFMDWGVGGNESAWREYGIRNVGMLNVDV